MKQVEWFSRNFSFESTQNIFPSILERLRGTPARLEEKLALIPADLLTRRLADTWTIKENIGHLIDLEPLWCGRLEDILTSQELLRPTDLQNTKTTEANHNAAQLEGMLAAFRKTRMATVALLDDLTEEQVFRSALHPRLRTPMRTMDLFLFVADHDDHHLARITELANTWKS